MCTVVAMAQSLVLAKTIFSSEEEFLFWKSWSDEDYKETDYADSYYHRHTVGLDSIGDNIKNTSTPEEVLICKLERDEQIQGAADLVQIISESLTEVQFRRLWLHHVEERMCAPSHKLKVLLIPASWQASHLLKEKF